MLAWDVSISMEADFCVRVLEQALARYGKPEIFNTDQGSQFTSLVTSQPRLACRKLGSFHTPSDSWTT